MELVTVKGLCGQIAQRWKNVYSKHILWNKKRHARDFTFKETYYKLLELGESPTPDEIYEIIGNNTWTNLTCNECYELVQSLVVLGEEPDYESNTAGICLKCLQKAINLINGDN